MSGFLSFMRVFAGRRFPFKIVYCKDYWMVDIGKHVFPVRKYRIIMERLMAMGAGCNVFLEPEPASDDDLRLVHTPRYLKKIADGVLSAYELGVLELPFSADLVRFFRLQVGGTILTARRALEDGCAIHIGGGFHHAFPDHGEGFCLFNDVAVAVEKLRSENLIRKAMIVDCDLHQGNGTAAVFARTDEVFTFSIHQMDIYPAEKPAGSLDVEMWSGDGDKEYLGRLRSHFPRLFREFEPDFVFYLAGADPYERDQLGGLRLTVEGLMERDRIVLESARKHGIPAAVVLAGGYAASVEDLAAVHVNTIKAARRAQVKAIPAEFRRGSNRGRNGLL